MRTMIDLGSQRGPIVLHIMDTATSVDCGRDVRLRRTFRSLIECMVPACCAFQPPSPDYSSSSPTSLSSSSSVDSFSDSSSLSTSTTSTHASTITGTFFGFRRGRVSFCIQEDAKSSPLVLLDLGIATSYLAREMQYGLLRIALVECESRHDVNAKQENGSLFSVPLWSVFFNGRKIGFASRRVATESDVRVLKLMQSVSAGAGVLPAVSTKGGSLDDKVCDERMYLRAKFERVSGSVDSESFHMINPDGSGSGQELSIFLLRS
ncbi:hypothetical protein DCAR_0519357 [Daucus carota subsp. sativus]|uniref:Protein MIZU-KUSSEI 1 n=1 Tax=Daucus carota subsp. sativus TaxID=79200 RepID=A0A164XX29_DAUCS|nr:PREDICTED: protein MIZU-KUSSEI 1-like [Daucus carota subsp. sativus]WOH00001.1 hypothetical protein DCAR_0519357 [Daucus carota subsp. sativus]